MVVTVMVVMATVVMAMVVTEVMEVMETMAEAQVTAVAPAWDKFYHRMSSELPKQARSASSSFQVWLSGPQPTQLSKQLPITEYRA
jgi:hypothetical protein